MQVALSHSVHKLRGQPANITVIITEYEISVMLPPSPILGLSRGASSLLHVLRQAMVTYSAALWFLCLGLPHDTRNYSAARSTSDFWQRAATEPFKTTQYWDGGHDYIGHDCITISPPRQCSTRMKGVITNMLVPEPQRAQTRGRPMTNQL